MIKFVTWSTGIILVLGIALIGAERLAAERIEVVELHTLDENSNRTTTRLWIVDDEGLQYLRVGGDGSGWFSRLQANKTIQLTRQGNTATYTPHLRPEKSERINQLMQDKYTWGDTLIGLLVGSREGSIPIELRPASLN